MALSTITNWLQGRTTTFCAAFFVTGNVLHWLHKLDGTYITFMGTLLGVIVGHSIKEDLLSKKDDDKQ